MTGVDLVDRLISSVREEETAETQKRGVKRRF